MARSPRKSAPEAATSPAGTPPPVKQSLFATLGGIGKNTAAVITTIAAVGAAVVALTTQIPAIWTFVSRPFAPKAPVTQPFADVSGKWCVLNVVVNANDQNAKGDRNVFYVELKRVPDTAQFSGTGHKVGANGSRDVPGSELTIDASPVDTAEFQISFVEQVYKNNGLLSETKHPGWFSWSFDQGRMAGRYFIKNGFSGTSEAMPWQSDDCQDYIVKSSPPA